MQTVSPSTLRILMAIIRLAKETGLPCTIREAAKAAGYPEPSRIQYHMQTRIARLRQLGLIVDCPHHTARTLWPTVQFIPSPVRAAGTVEVSDE